MEITEDSGVLIFGPAGHGKTRFANTLLGRKEFDEHEEVCILD